MTNDEIKQKAMNALEHGTRDDLLEALRLVLDAVDDSLGEMPSKVRDR